MRGRGRRCSTASWSSVPPGTAGDRSPFDIERDYLRYVDGKPRHDGIRSFLEARGIDLPEGGADDPADRETVHGLGRRKNELFLELLEREGAQTFDDAVEQLRRWRGEGLATALITSSRNGRRILAAAGLDDLFDVTVDGNDAARLGIAGKPSPDIFLHAAGELGVEPARAVVLEDAISGVEAGRAGDFGLVVGVARNGGEGLTRRARTWWWTTCARWRSPGSPSGSAGRTGRCGSGS
jgi:trehalose 6-phosphate phosphatase